MLHPTRLKPWLAWSLTEGGEGSLIEMVKLRVSQINRYAYCIDMHTKKLVAEGESNDRVHRLQAWREGDYLQRTRANGPRLGRSRDPECRTAYRRLASPKSSRDFYRKRAGRPYARHRRVEPAEHQLPNSSGLPILKSIVHSGMHGAGRTEAS